MGALLVSAMQGSLVQSSRFQTFICYSSEDKGYLATHVLPPLLAAARKQEVLLLSVILSPCLFAETELARLYTFDQHQPFSTLSEMNKGKQAAVWMQVAQLSKQYSQRVPSS